ncbi:MAG: ATP-binding protein [Candidatus Nezhaarchaeota archaeon]|nr:ATP-binding protein [Candidatus Nezhaarchaeota archaeon]
MLGYVIGESTPSSAWFLSIEPPKLGQYVIIEHGEGDVLGMVEGLISGSVSLRGDVHDPKVVERLRKLEGSRDFYVKGRIKVLGDLETLSIPRSPPQPGAEVRRAGGEALARVFGRGGGPGVKIGSLISHPEVPVYVDVNRMVTRHLAILAMTGAGKSNAVAVIASGLVSLGGTVLIFDMHSEYTKARLSEPVNVVEPSINPMHMTPGELMQLMKIEARYHVQERLFRKAHREALKACLEEPKDFLEALGGEIERLESKLAGRQEREAIASLLNKLEAFRDRYEKIVDLGVEDVASRIREGVANVVDLGRVDEEAADVIVSHTLRRILDERKRRVLEGRGRLTKPIFTVLEEAHILAPASRDTLSKYWVSRIAREGRKFGVGLCLVSQRPKALDPDALSQANNMIVLRMVEPTDQRHVQQASEALSDDLLAHLPSLNVGEAIVLGMMIKVPALVKIDHHPSKLAGGDVDVAAEWLRPRPSLDEFKSLIQLSR